MVGRFSNPVGKLSKYARQCPSIGTMITGRYYSIYFETTSHFELWSKIRYMQFRAAEICKSIFYSQCHSLIVNPGLLNKDFLIRVGYPQSQNFLLNCPFFQPPPAKNVGTPGATCHSELETPKSRRVFFHVFFASEHHSPHSFSTKGLVLCCDD